MQRLVLASVLAFSVIGCSSGPKSGVGDEARRNIITYEEIQTARTTSKTAWELVYQLRPFFLRSHSAQSLEARDPIYAVVYLDEIYHGELESLRDLSLDQIKSIQFLPPFDASTRFATPMPGGAIMVRTH